MKRQMLLPAAAALFAMGAGGAFADCQSELDQLTQVGISKDGSLAPLQEPGEAMPQTGAGDAAEGEGAATSEGEIVKDGSQAPLETAPELATSGQDAQAQQQGGATAAEQAAGAEPADDLGRDAAIARAEEALARGDEAACMRAVEEAQAS